jgi:hypothetical protein
MCSHYDRHVLFEDVIAICQKNLIFAKPNLEVGSFSCNANFGHLKRIFDSENTRLLRQILI